MEEDKKEKKKGLWRALPLKIKLIIIGALSSLILLIIFLIVLITPLMSLGIIDIEGTGSISSDGISYSSISSSTKFFWPIGSDETEEIGGVLFAKATPPASSITSEFGPRQDPTNTSVSENHGALDISTGRGSNETNIIAVADGTVSYVNDGVEEYDESGGGGYGNHVKIEHADGTITLYAHMYKGSITVETGDTVKQGQVIGKMGSSGKSTGTHLHFEVRVNSEKVDPMNYVSIENARPDVSSLINYVDDTSSKRAVCLTLRNSGITDEGVIALLTNIYHESGFSPTIEGDVHTSYGLCQWHNERWTNLQSSYPDNYDTVEGQLNFLFYELQNDYPDLYNTLKTTTDSEDTTYNFCVNFERPADTTKTCNIRKDDSKKFVDYVKNNCSEGE